MELSRLVHDDFVIQHQVDDPAERHLREVLHAAEVDVSVSTLDANRLVGSSGGTNGSSGKSSEHTPLLAKSPRGNRVVDLDKVEEILTLEEVAAVEEDAKLSVRKIVSEETVALAKIGIPTILLALLEFVPGTALTIMAGHVSVDDSARILAAYNLSDMLQGLFLMFLAGGVESAISTFCSQAFGGKRMVEFWLYCQAALLVFAASTPFVFAATLSGSRLLKFLGQDPMIADLAGEFMAVSTLAIPFTVMYTVLACALQTQSIMVPSVVASIVSWSVGVSAAYLLSYHTSLGYLGLALAGPICAIMKTLTLGRVVLRSETFVDSWPGWKLSEAAALVPKVARITTYSVLMVTFQNFNSTGISLLAGALPNSGVTVAANNIFMSTIQLPYIPLLGVAIGGAIRIGNALGAGKARRAAILSRMVVAGTMSASIVLMVATVFVAKPYAAAFTPDQEVVQVATTLTYRLLIIIPVLGFVHGTQFIMRGCGKQLVVAALNFTTMAVVGVPLMWVFGMQLDGGLTGLWLGNLTGMLSFSTAAVVWLYKISWKKLAHEAKHNTHMGFKAEEEDHQKMTRVADAF